jgi:predicted phosphoadenosine phosphosulfate sulfurtransferase
MSSLKRYRQQNVLDAARERIAYAFDNFERLYVSFSGGKDSTVLMHLVMAEAERRDRTVGVLIVDLEAQYRGTYEHVATMVGRYRDHIDLHWVCLPMSLRNAVSNYEPSWVCWDPEVEPLWVREKPIESLSAEYDWFVPGMEFEEFVVLWGEWYAQGCPTGGFVGIRADESLNRFRTIAVWDKEMHNNQRWTTRIGAGELYNLYPLYDWRTEDIWRFHGKYPELPSNPVYDLMYKAGVPLSQQRLCQPYGVDQRKGLWLYHVLEPDTWYKLITRVNGANTGALYIQESGNITGQRVITKPPGHTWKSFTNLLLASLPKPTREHYIRNFQAFIRGWRSRGYDEIPDQAPLVLENAHWAPSYRRMAKCLLRNDWWCKGLGRQQPKSEAYGTYLALKKGRKERAKAEVLSNAIANANAMLDLFDSAAQ